MKGRWDGIESSADYGSIFYSFKLACTNCPRYHCGPRIRRGSGIGDWNEVSGGQLSLESGVSKVAPFRQDESGVVARKQASLIHFLSSLHVTRNQIRGLYRCPSNRS